MFIAILESVRRLASFIRLAAPILWATLFELTGKRQMMGSQQSETYGMSVFRLSACTPLASLETPTLLAIAQGLNHNGQVISQEIGREIAYQQCAGGSGVG